ncbi:MAG: hypothetical protein ACYC2T_09040 [Bacillota bacterium]
MSIKLANGKYFQTPFSGHVFIHPLSDLYASTGNTGYKGILITPSKDFSKIFNKVIKGRIKINTVPKSVQTSAIIRNKKLGLNRVMYQAYSDDPIFKAFSFKKGQSLEDYELKTLQKSRAQGIDPERLRSALDAAKNEIGDNINKVPVLIETINYQGIDSLLFAFAWEARSLEGLGHIWVLIIDANTDQVLFSDHCG